MADRCFGCIRKGGHSLLPACSSCAAPGAMGSPPQAAEQGDSGCCQMKAGKWEPSFLEHVSTSKTPEDNLASAVPSPATTQARRSLCPSTTLVMVLNLLLLSFFFLLIPITFLSSEYYGHSLQASLAKVKPDAHMHKHGQPRPPLCLCLQDAERRVALPPVAAMQGAARRVSYSKPAAFKTCELSQQQLCSLAVWPLGISGGLVCWGWGR